MYYIASIYNTSANVLYCHILITPFEYILDIFHDAWNRNFVLFDMHKYVQQFVFKIYRKLLKLCEANFYSCLHIKHILRLIGISFRRTL